MNAEADSGNTLPLVVAPRLPACCSTEPAVSSAPANLRPKYRRRKLFGSGVPTEAAPIRGGRGGLRQTRWLNWFAEWNSTCMAHGKPPKDRHKRRA